MDFEPHPSDDLLGAYAEGGLGKPQRRRLEQHFAACGDCRDLLLAASQMLPPPLLTVRAPHGARRTAWALAASVVLVAAAALQWILPPQRPPAPLASFALQRLQPAAASASAAPRPRLQAASDRPEDAPHRWVAITPSVPPVLPAMAMGAAPAPAAAPPTRLDFSTLRSGFRDQQATVLTRKRLASWGGVTMPQPTLASAPSTLVLPRGPRLDSEAGAAWPMASGFTNTGTAVSVPLTAPLTASLGWAISRSGDLLKAVASGIWKTVPLAPGVQVRVLLVRGKRIWAAGQSDALFTSSDRGAHWTRVSLPTVSSRPEPLQSITFADSEHGVVTAVDGQTWTTSDGGQTWVPH
ncbi:MAG: zf-HC2 domain-containing protein [Terriglobales bacterium]